MVQRTQSLAMVSIQRIIVLGWLLMVCLGTWCTPAAAIQAKIQWSPTATQQVRDWANNGGGSWVHTVERSRGPNGRYR